MGCSTVATLKTVALLSSVSYLEREKENNKMKSSTIKDDICELIDHLTPYVQQFNCKTTPSLFFLLAVTHFGSVPVFHVLLCGIGLDIYSQCGPVN